MSKWHGGKGSRTRPVDKKAWEDNYDRIWGKKNKDEKKDERPSK